MGSVERKLTNMKVFVLLVVVASASADFIGHGHSGDARAGRQLDAVQGGIDFSNCEQDAETGLCCVNKEETVQTLQKDPILECTHKDTEQCHYTYVTKFVPAQEQVCEETFEKSCQITFKQQAFNETVEKCYTPVSKECNGQGETICETVYESSCTTKYVEKQPGKFVADTKCEKLPIEICGAGCVFTEGEQECHNKVLPSVVDVPEEVCDLNPQKICKYETKLVPRLSPKYECTIVPKETCHLKFTTPTQIDEPLETKWCLDPTPAAPGQQYDESNAAAPLLTSAGSRQRSVAVRAPPQYQSAPAQYAPISRF